MSARGRLFRTPVLASSALALALALTACGGDAGTSGSGGETTPSSSASSSASASDGAGESGSDQVAVTVTREGDSFTPNGERVDLKVGQTLELTLDADEAGELHIHSTPEQEIAYEAGTSTHEITIDRPGVVEVESHEPAVILLQLEVR